jgi:tryptophan synthase alpha chain
VGEGIMSRIDATFERLRRQGRKALIPFITAGDPDLQLTLPIMQALVAGGADVIELGVPFSDPMADGPIIQRASERALKQGTTLRQVLGLVNAFRRLDEKTPVVLMGYANPIEAMGYDAFVEGAKTCGVDGVLVVDYPPEEGEALARRLTAVQIDPIYLLSPTTPEGRIAQVARLARGYVYYVSLKGVTGASHLDLEDVRARITVLRQSIRLPIGVGFGIRDARTAQAVAEVADAVVVGSRIVQEIEASPREAVPARVQTLVASLRQGMDRAAAVGKIP